MTAVRTCAAGLPPSHLPDEVYGGSRKHVLSSTVLTGCVAFDYLSKSAPLIGNSRWAFVMLTHLPSFVQST